MLALRGPVDKDEAIRDLMAKLMRAVEDSLSTSAAVRDALAELVRQGYEARLFFVANAETPEDESGEATETEAEALEVDLDGSDKSDDEAGHPTLREIGAVADTSELSFELTKLDRDFLKSLHIRPENG
jgi:hypothetical protein